MNADSASFLRTPSGYDLLAEAASLPPDRLTRITRLRKRYPHDHIAAAVEILELRERAKTKFSRADSMFFTREGLEQSSGESIAAWRASRFPKDAIILDLCCGIGGDSAHLGFRGPVLSFDVNPVAVHCTAANSQVYGVADSVSLACADV